jgi:hypothetical protein
VFNLNKKVVCKDGFTMSVQAGETQYCHPRETGAEKYTEVEIGFPNRSEDLLLEFADRFLLLWLASLLWVI